MKIAEEFFQGEYREDFYISSMVKRAWAAELEVLEVIADICKKHDIKWFADWGTLLGTIRHKGFVPWDDDIDICMKRADYWKFISVAQKELPEGYLVLNMHTQPGFSDMLTRVVNSQGICLDEENLKRYHGFPYVIGIDIFPLDFLPVSDEAKKQQCQMIESVLTIPQLMEQNAISKENLWEILKQLQDTYGVTFDLNRSIEKQLYCLGEQLCGLYSEEESEELTSMLDFVNGWKEYRIPKVCYSESVAMSFEGIVDMPVPVGYDQVLRTKYRDYWVIYRGGGSHDYPGFRSQEAVLREHMNKNDVIVPEFLKQEMASCVHALKKPLPNDIRSFVQLRENDFYYVDKSLFIKDFSEFGQKKVLICGYPSGCKSVLVDTLLNFHFRDMDANGCKKSHKELYCDLAVNRSGATGLAKKEEYPIQVFLWEEKEGTVEGLEIGIKRYLHEQFAYYRFLLLSDVLSVEERQHFEEIVEAQFPYDIIKDEECVFLRKCIERYHGNKTILAIHDYDIPLEAAYQNGCYREVAERLRMFYETLISDEEVFEYVIITGRSNIHANDVFPAEWNVQNINPLDAKFGKYFGFTHDEVKEMLQFYNLTNYMEMVKEWFGGYYVGGTELYNPWNILNFVMSFCSGAKEPIPYWANAKLPKLLQNRLKQLDSGQKEEIRKLANGESLKVELHTELTYQALYENREYLWDALLQNGVLVKQNGCEENGRLYAQVKAPNLEIKTYFKHLLSEL